MPDTPLLPPDHPDRASLAAQRRITIPFLRSLLAHDYDAHADKWAGERIILSSIEAAKGLEFEHVIIPDLNRSDFDGERADERNLFYVAASRARRQLTLVHRPGQASSYLRHFVSN